MPQGSNVRRFSSGNVPSGQTCFTEQ
jgi:hypothetical protein